MDLSNQHNMDHSFDDDHEICDYNNDQQDCDYNSDPDYDTVPNYLSDNSDIEDFDDYEATKTNFRGEATFGPKETIRLPVQVVVAEVGPEPNLISYGTNFDILLAEDPVHARILDLIVENAVDPNIILFTKLNLVKLAAINKAKASNIEDAELASMMTAVSLAQKDEKATRQTQNNEERVMRDCIDQIHCLNKINHLEERVKATLRKIIKTSRYELPNVINMHNPDDLCGTLYALVSDNYYRDAPAAADIDDLPQADHVSDTASSLGLVNKPHKYVPNPGIHFGVNLITHLTLVGGLPMRSKKIYTIDRARFENFKGNISECLKSSRSSQCHRLGVLTEKQMEHGDWLYQVATDMESLDLEYTSWQVVDETSFKTFPFVKDTQVFLIHVSLTIIFCSSLFHSLAHRYL